MKNQKITTLVSGGKLEITPCGDPVNNRVYLFVHGFFSDSGIWSGWISSLVRRNTCYALTFPGRIDDGLNAPGIGMEDYATAVVEALSTIRHLEPEAEVVIVSHSAGCLATCMALAVSNTTPKAVIHLNPAPMKEIALPWAVRLRSLRYLPKILGGEAFRLTEEDTQEILLAGFRLEEGGDSALIEVREESGTAVRDLLFGVRVSDQPSCKTVVIACEHDRMTPPYVAAGTVELLRLKSRGGESHLTCLTLRGCGHLPMLGAGALGRLIRVLDTLDD